MNNSKIPQTYYLSYACGFVSQKSFDLTPVQYLDLLIQLIPNIQSTLRTKIPVDRLELHTKTLECSYENSHKKKWAIDISEYKVNDPSWGGGAYNNCLNEHVISAALKALKYPVTTEPLEFSIIGNTKLVTSIQNKLKTTYAQNLHFNVKEGSPRQAYIFTCAAIHSTLLQTATIPTELQNKLETLITLGLNLRNPIIIQNNIPKSINIHNRIPHFNNITTQTINPQGFYPINNHLPEETFETLSKLPKKTAIEFRIGSTQIHQLCEVELPKFKKKFPHLLPADITINREEFPSLWLLQRAQRISLNFAEALEIFEHENRYKFLPSELNKDFIIKQFICNFKIQNAIISDGTNPLIHVIQDSETHSHSIESIRLEAKIKSDLEQLFEKHHTPLSKNETGCGDCLIVGIQIAERLKKLYFPDAPSQSLIKFGLTLALTKYLFSDSNLGSMPQKLLDDCVALAIKNYLFTNTP